MNNLFVQSVMKKTLDARVVGVLWMTAMGMTSNRIIVVVADNVELSGPRSG